MNLSWSDKIVAAFTVAVDYFNHHVFGWEPFIENWAVLQMKSFVKDNTRTFEIVTGHFVAFEKKKPKLSNSNYLLLLFLNLKICTFI